MKTAFTYELLDENRIEFKSSANELRIFNYKLDRNSLVLSGGGCIEACGVKFRKLH